GKVRKKRYIEITCKLQVIRCEKERAQPATPREEEMWVRVLSVPSLRSERITQLATSLLERETVNISVEDVVRARPIAASPVKHSRSTTGALVFLIGCVTLMMTGFAVILPVFPQRLQALGLGSEMLA